MENVFPIAVAGLALVVAAWLAVRARRRVGRSLGLVGALLSVPAVASVAWPELVPWAWTVPQLPVVLWLAALVLLGVGLLPRAGGGTRSPTAVRVCNALALLISGSAFLVFFWIATVSPGGV